MVPIRSLLIRPTNAIFGTRPTLLVLLIYIDQLDWLGLISVNLVHNDIWAACTNFISEGVDLFVPSVIHSNKVRPDTKAKTKVIAYPNYIRKAMARKQCLTIYARRWLASSA